MIVGEERRGLIVPLRVSVVLLAALLLTPIGVAGPARAEEANTELAKKTQNPVADLISIPLQNNMNFGIGPNHRTQNVLNVQPVIPFNLNQQKTRLERGSF